MDIKRLFDIPAYQKKHYPKDDALCCKANGEWRKYSIDDVIDWSNRAGRAFVGMGLKKDEKIAIISNNRPEWNFVDYGAMQAGLVNVPVYPTISEEDYVYILNNAEVKLLFVSSVELYENMARSKVRGHALKEMITFDVVPGAMHWKEFL